MRTAFRSMLATATVGDLYTTRRATRMSARDGRLRRLRILHYRIRLLATHRAFRDISSCSLTDGCVLYQTTATRLPLLCRGRLVRRAFYHNLHPTNLPAACIPHLHAYSLPSIICSCNSISSLLYYSSSSSVFPVIMDILRSIRTLVQGRGWFFSFAMGDDNTSTHDSTKATVHGTIGRATCCAANEPSARGQQHYAVVPPTYSGSTQPPPLFSACQACTAFAVGSRDRLLADNDDMTALLRRSKTPAPNVEPFQLLTGYTEYDKHRLTIPWTVAGLATWGAPFANDDPSFCRNLPKADHPLRQPPIAPGGILV